MPERTYTQAELDTIIRDGLSRIAEHLEGCARVEASRLQAHGYTPGGYIPTYLHSTDALHSAYSGMAAELETGFFDACFPALTPRK